jgi:predicted ATPase
MNGLESISCLSKEDKFALTDISRDVANLVPGILRIRVEQDKPSDRYVIYAETADRRSFSSQVLSDGTLRLLALATLRNDPQFHGILCLEEPENGVDPLHLAKMTRLLREMATDFKGLERVNEPLRQVLITTHSPAFISQNDVLDSLLLTIIPTRVQGKNAPSIRVTRMIPVITSLTEPQAKEEEGLDKAVEFYSIDMVKKYLDKNTIEEAQNRLKEARVNLSKR